MKHYKREWLNESEGIASVVQNVFWGLDKDDPVGTTYNPSVEATLTLSDCNRTVCLEFYTYGDEDAESALYKINKLEEAVKEFKWKYLEAYAERKAYAKTIAQNKDTAEEE